VALDRQLAALRSQVRRWKLATDATLEDEATAYLYSLIARAITRADDGDDRAAADLRAAYEIIETGHHRALAQRRANVIDFAAAAAKMRARRAERRRRP
jgi:hypothetical protein